MAQAQIERYHTAVSRVRKYDGNAAIGMASNVEIARLERMADQFEEREKISLAKTPDHSAVVALNDLWGRYHRARSEVLKWQEELQRHRPQLAILGAPVGYFQEPEAIASAAPSFKSTEECETFNTTFGHKVFDLETKVRTLKDYCQQWTRLTLEQQNRKLIMAIADRI
jgi:hypothetical protein